MGCSLFSNSHFQMGVTAIGFAAHFGLSYSARNEHKKKTEITLEYSGETGDM